MSRRPVETAKSGDELQRHELGTAVQGEWRQEPPETMGPAYETHGVEVPVGFLHGLTFDRRTWRPIIERLGGSVRSIAIDLGSRSRR